MRRQDGVVSRGFKTAPKSALTSQRILWPGHHYRDAGGHDDRADRAFDAPMTSILYPDLQNWNSESCCPKPSESICLAMVGRTTSGRDRLTVPREPTNRSLER